MGKIGRYDTPIGPAREWIFQHLGIISRKAHLEIILLLQAEKAKLGDQLAMTTLELESLKKKIVERAQVTPILKAKSAAEIRRVMEQEQEREFEEANGA
jgi:hypothetical protein